VSTVLWANLLVDGKVECESEDRYALYKHADKLDALSKKLGLPSFQALCDTTDVRFNMDEFELPEGVESTSEVMAVDGAWLPIADAITMLERLLAHITEHQTRFGLLSNGHALVVEELGEVLAFAKAGVGRAQKFNFGIVT
jgi:hypothetical protein